MATPAAHPAPTLSIFARGLLSARYQAPTAATPRHTYHYSYTGTVAIPRAGTITLKFYLPNPHCTLEVIPLAQYTVPMKHVEMVYPATGPRGALVTFAATPVHNLQVDDTRENTISWHCLGGAMTGVLHFEFVLRSNAGEGHLLWEATVFG